MKHLKLILLFILVSAYAFGQGTPPSGTRQLSTNQGYINPADSTIWWRISATGVPSFYYQGVRMKELKDSLNKRVTKVPGKGLSENDYTSAEKSKLAGIASGATANQTDAYLLSRANHTGNQAISTVTGLQTALDGKIATTEKAAANGVASLGADGKVPNSQIPALAISETFPVASEAAMLALSAAEQGDVAVRSDISKSFILQQAPASTLANWVELLTPTDAVQSVNGMTGNVTLTTSNISEGSNKYYTDALVNAVAPTLTGTGATGTWGINISGNSATATTTSRLAAYDADLDDTIEIVNVPGSEALVVRGVNSISNGSLVVQGALGAVNFSSSNGRITNAPTTSESIVRLNEISSGHTIGANTTGNAATATNSNQWNGQNYTGATNTTPTGEVLAFSGTDWRPTTFTQLGLGSAAYQDNGASTLNAGQWNTQTYQPLQSGTINVLMAHDGGSWKYTDASAVKTFLGIPSGGETLQSVTDRGNIAKTSILVGTTDLSIGSTGSFLQVDQGTTTGNTYSRIRAFSHGGSQVNDLSLQSSGGNVGIGTTSPSAKLDVNGDASFRTGTNRNLRIRQVGMNMSLNATNDADNALVAFGISASTLDINATTTTFSGNASSSTAPTTGDHLTNKTYVDAAISGAVSGKTKVVTRAVSSGDYTPDMSDGANVMVILNTGSALNFPDPAVATNLTITIRPADNTINAAYKTSYAGTVEWSNGDGTYMGSGATNMTAGYSASWTSDGTHWILNRRPSPIIFSGTGPIDFPSTAAGANSVVNKSLAGAKAGSIVSVGIPDAFYTAVTTNFNIMAWVATDGIVSFKFMNLDPSTTVDPASFNISYRVSN